MGHVGVTRAIGVEDVEAYRRDGVVVLRGVLPATWIERLEPSVGVAFEGDATADLSAMAPGAGDTPGARFRAGVEHWRDDPVMRAFACDSPLPGIAAALLASDQVWLWEDSVLVKPPGTREETRLHQDLAYFPLEGTQLATFWCPLDPVGPATGSLRFVRGSHRWDREFRPHLFVTDEPIAGTLGERVPDIDPDDPAVLCVDLEPGDITVHDARTLHGAGPNTSTSTWRRAVSVRYCGDDVRVHHRPGMQVSPGRASLVEGAALIDGDVTPRVWP